ncbi:MAG: DUF962 domain-containing protein [Saprospiraceae bacterium]|nr:DUF962 domain-containing protein [Saprospiraceae bacterium]
MAKSMQWLLDKYGENHKNHTNKLIHWVCVPLIVFSLFGLIFSIPFFTDKTMLANWAAIVWTIALLYYLRLSFSMFLGFVGLGFLVLWGNYSIYEAVGKDSSMHVYISLGIFVIAWVGQFIGHKIEGQKPSFLEDLQFLMVGPAWLLHFIYSKLGIPY